MDLTLHRPGDHLFVHSVTADGIRIVDDLHQGPLVVSPGRLLTDWPVRSCGELTHERLQPIFDLDPDIVLIGTGKTQVFLPPELMMAFYSRGIGVEVMTTEAACRTFNVLVSEERRVVAALMPLNPTNPHVAG
jgi:uncharacterized protein